MTVIEHGQQLAGREDPDVATALKDLFIDEGIEVVLDAQTRRVEGYSANRVRVTLERSTVRSAPLLKLSGGLVLRFAIPHVLVLNQIFEQQSCLPPLSRVNAPEDLIVADQGRTYRDLNRALEMGFWLLHAGWRSMASVAGAQRFRSSAR